MLSREIIVLCTVLFLTILGLFIFVPRTKIREGIVVFFFKQFMTWLFGLLVVEYGLIEYPVREFEKASQTSFSFEYFIYPAVCVVFNLRYPVNKTRFHKIVWFLAFPTWMTILEVWIEKKTELITYIHWTWYWTWITLFLTFLLSRKFYCWFFKK